MTDPALTLLPAGDRYLEALRVYLAEGIDQDFQQRAFHIGVEGRNGGYEGGPDAKAHLRRLIAEHSAPALDAFWTQLTSDQAWLKITDADRAEFSAAIAAVFDLFTDQQPGLYGAWNPEPQSNRFGAQIEQARAVLHRATIAPAIRAAVVTAAQDVAEAEAALTAAHATLDQAVAARDLAGIAEQRQTIELDLPDRIDDAAQALHEARAAEAQALAEPARLRLAQVEAEGVAAGKALEKARAALAAAEVRARSVGNLLEPTRAAARSVEAAAADAQARAHDHAKAMERRRVERTRSFAGVSR